MARSAPAHDRKAVAALEAAFGIELEGAEEGRRAESPGGAQWVVRAELEATGGDERGCIGLGGHVVELAERARASVGHQLRRAWPELRRSAGLRVPLHGREQALRIAAQQGGKGGEAGREAAPERPGD